MRDPLFIKSYGMYEERCILKLMSRSQWMTEIASFTPITFHHAYSICKWESSEPRKESSVIFVKKPLNVAVKLTSLVTPNKVNKQWDNHEIAYSLRLVETLTMYLISFLTTQSFLNNCLLIINTQSWYIWKWRKTWIKCINLQLEPPMTFSRSSIIIYQYNKIEMHVYYSQAINVIQPTPTPVS